MTLENLLKTKQLKAEPPDRLEFEGLLESARRRLRDSQRQELSEDGQFSLAYGAAHALSLAALRWHGYRTEQRYLVFQCLQHTLGLEYRQWRVLSECHNVRNKAEYEGRLEISESMLRELIAVTEDVLRRVEALGPFSSSQ